MKYTTCHKDIVVQDDINRTNGFVCNYRCNRIYSPLCPPLAHLTPNFAANKTHLTHTSWTNKRFVEMDGSKNKE